jgi:hypothetical protein
MAGREQDEVWIRNPERVWLIHKPQEKILFIGVVVAPAKHWKMYSKKEIYDQS